jgi:hypothetical protein
VSTTVEGTEELIRNLNSQIARLPAVTVAGLMAGALIFERESKKRVPVEKGILRASGYSRRAPDLPVAAEVGFSASYAAAVHDAPGKLRGQPRRSGIGVYWGPRGEPQFLANTIRDNAGRALNAVARVSQVRK